MVNHNLWLQMLGRSFDPRQWFDEESRPEEAADGSQGVQAMWVYRKVTEGRWAVGFYSPDREWNCEGVYDDRETAAGRVHWLNGGGRLTRTSKEEGSSVAGTRY